MGLSVDEKIEKLQKQIEELERLKYMVSVKLKPEVREEWMQEFKLDNGMVTVNYEITDKFKGGYKHLIEIDLALMNDNWCEGQFIDGRLTIDGIVFDPDDFIIKCN